MHYQQKTKKGYDFGEVASAMQKSIRRGLEEDALYWVVELYNSGFSEYAWKRLQIITSEDVGLAEPHMAAEIEALYQMFLRQAKKTKATEDKNAPERLYLVHAVMKLCRAKKSRAVDWALIHFFGSHNHSKKEIPDFALDKHTERGRRLKRSWKHFFDVGSWLENLFFIDKEAEYQEKAKDTISHPNGSDLFTE